MSETPEALNAAEALEEYIRLVSIYSPDNRQYELGAVEAHLNHVVVFQWEGQPPGNAALAALKADLVDVVAVGRDAGVPTSAFTEHRGWFSHRDIADLIYRSQKPTDIGVDWPQRIALKGVSRDIRELASTDGESASRLAQSARAFLGQWADQVPTSPPAEMVRGQVSQYRPHLIAAWEAARVQLQEEIKSLPDLAGS